MIAIRCCLAFTFLFAVGDALRAQEIKKNTPDATRHTQRGVGFSFVVPEGWTPRENPGHKYKMIAGPVIKAFTSNIVVSEEVLQGTWNEYLDAVGEQLKKEFKKTPDRKEIKTIDGLTGSVFSFEHEFFGHHLRQAFYIFPADKMLFIVTCSVPADGGKKFDAIFEKSMQTFRVEK